MNLKTHLCILTVALIALAPWQARAQAGVESDPAFLPIEKAIDLKAIRPEVNVNLPRFLLMDAVSEWKGGTNDPFAASGVNLADLVKDVKLIRVVVIDTDKTNHTALAKGVATLRNILETKWTPIATVPDDNVGIYALSDASGETMTGLALLIHDDGDAVIANIVGRVSLGKIIKVASSFDKFPKDILKVLGGVDTAKSEKPESAPAKTKH